MKGPRSRILALLAILLLVAASFQLASPLGSGREDRATERDKRARARRQRSPRRRTGSSLSA